MVVVVTTLSFSASALTYPKSRQTSTEVFIILPPRILVIKRIIDLKISIDIKLASEIIGASKKVRLV
jgi:hypothetical protein